MVFERRAPMRRMLSILGASTVLSSMAVPMAAFAADAAPDAAPSPEQAPPAATAATPAEPQSGGGQSADGQSTGGLGEIVVTATHRAESLQKVPISIQALGAETLAQHQVTSFADYAGLLPSVSFSGLGPGQSEVYFRGIAVDGGSLSTSGTYLDDVPISAPARMPEVHIYDIERVEALSGPQGTLYGAGSLAGTLRIITNKAKIGKFEAGYDVQVDAYGKGQPGAMVEGFVNIPVNDNIAIRMMGFYDHEGGYIDNTHGTYTYQLGDNDPNTTYTVDNAALVQKDYNPVDSYGGRINMTIEAGDWAFYPSITFQHLDAKGYFNYDPRVGDLKVHDYSPTENIDRWLQASLTIKGKIGDFDLVSSSGYFKRKIDNTSDYTYYSVHYDQLGPGYENYLKFKDHNGNFINPTQSYIGRIWQSKVTQELRLSVPKSWGFDFTVGAFFQYQKQSNDDDYQIPGLSKIDLATSCDNGCEWNPAIKRDGFYNVDLDQKFRDYAIFAEGTVPITSTLKATAGVRGFKANNSVYGFSGVASLALGLGCTLPFPADQRLTCINNDKPHYKETGETHKFSLAWQVTPDKMVYATYSTGFRPGGVNSLAEMQAYEADRLTNYEIGFKTNWRNILRWNAAIYYEKWTGIQYTIIPLGYFGNGGTVNAGAARVYGIETDFSLKLGKFTISGSGAYNNAALTQDFCALDPATLVPLSNCSDNPDAVAAAKGTRLPRQPRFKGQLTARYDGDWGSVKDFAQLTMHAQTMSTSNLDTYKNSLLGNTPGFVSFDMSAGISRDNWTLTAFIENMFDRRGQLSKNTFCAIEYCSGSSRTMPIKPQYFGLKYSVRY